MGIGVFPLFRSGIDGASFDSDGKALAADLHLLDEVARIAGARPFTSFCDDRELPANFDPEVDDPDDFLDPWDEWFTAADGVVTIDAILAGLAGNPREPRRALIEDLTELRRCLQRAAEEGVEFRLEMA